MRSTGNTPDYIRHTYKVSNVLKSYTVYSLSHVDWNKNQLTDIVRIEKFQGKSSATQINDYLRLRNTTNWSKCKMVTGLRPTNIEGLFYGDSVTSNKKKTLLIFHMQKDRSTLIIDVYRGFYPYHKGMLQNIINTY